MNIVTCTNVISCQIKPKIIFNNNLNCSCHRQHFSLFSTRSIFPTEELVKEQKQLFFDEYHLSDTSKKYVTALESRTKVLGIDIQTKIFVKQRSFQESVESIFPEIPPTWDESKKMHIW